MLARSVVLITALFARGVAAQATERHFASPPCHVSFSYPADWEVAADTTDRAASCSFTLRPRDLAKRVKAHDGVDVFSVQIRTFARGVWRQAGEGTFERRANGWVVVGRMGDSAPADSITGAGWSGLRGIAPAGCYRQNGGYAGTCDDPTALLGTSTRSVLLIGGPQSESVFARVVATLRFEP